MRSKLTASGDREVAATLRFCVLLGFVAGMSGVLVGGYAYAASPAPPESVNWVARGVVPAVRDQGACGGDYAFAGSGAVDSLYAIRRKQSVAVSEQQLLDCASAYSGHGCGGSALDTAFQYIAAHGATTSDAYPYAGVGGECKIDGGPITIKGYVDVPQGNCEALRAAVAHQPVMAVVNGEALADYKGGILTSNVANPNPDHAVLVVGYTPDYWLVQNSWGSNWGEQGYVRLQRGNTLGICEMAVYPKL